MIFKGHWPRIYILVILVIVLGGASLISWRVYRKTINTVEYAIKELVYDLARDTSETSGADFLKGAGAFIDNILRYPTVAYVAMIDADGSIIIEAGSNPFLFSISQRQFDTKNWVNMHETSDYFSFSMPVFINDISESRFLYAMYMIVSKDPLNKLLISNFFETLITLFLFAVLLSLCSFLLVSRSITDPLKKLTILMSRENPRAGDINIDKENPYEINAIFTAFRELLIRIEKRDRDSGQHQEQLRAFVEERTKELVLARDEALAASQAKTVFIANMSHELRTPLQAIIGYSDIILKNTDHYPLYGEKVCRISAAAMHLLSLINNILDLSKVEAGKIEVNYDIVSLPELVESIRSNIEPMVSEQHNEFIVSVSEDILFIKSDPTKLRQILLNILTNANKVTSQGKISLNIDILKGDLVQFVIKDTGPGIPEQEIDRIFEKFYRLGGVADRGYSGTGIGLALTKELCRLLGGTISVESEVGLGSTFTVILPGAVEDSLFLMSNKAKITSETSTPLNILLAEDDAVAQDVFSEILRSAGHSCHIVDDGQQALDILTKQEMAGIDLAILDYQMSGLTGLEVIERYQSIETRHVPIIIITADATELAQQKFASYHVEFMTKPVMPDELLERIRFIMGSHV